MAGKIIADTLEHSTAGSVTTDYVVNGSAKAWANFNAITTTAVRDSLNISSLTDSATGNTTITLTSSMSDANYTGSMYNNATSGVNAGSFNNDYAGGFGGRSASSYGVWSYDGTSVDSYFNDTIILGDLA